MPNPVRGAAAAGQAARVTLPGVTVAWVDYYGGLHLGDLATQAQRVLATIPAATGAARSFGAATAPGARYSLVAWAPADCPFSGDCPVEITNTATLATISVRSPLHHGFASAGVVFSPPAPN